MNKDFVKDVVKDVVKEFGVELSERQMIILEMIYLDSTISAKGISQKISEKNAVDERTIQRDLAKIKKSGILTRQGGRKNGEWEIITRPGMTASCPTIRPSCPTTQTVMPDLIGHLTDHDF